MTNINRKFDNILKSFNIIKQDTEDYYYYPLPETIVFYNLGKSVNRENFIDKVLAVGIKIGISLEKESKDRIKVELEKI